ncbi:hypothetical protein ES702_02199 [subsurface metagenome]
MRPESGCSHSGRIRVSNDILRHKPQESIFKHRFQILRD